MMAVGVDAQFFCARRVVPVFKAQGHGSIINLNSSAGLFGYPTRSPYAAAKWAVSGFTKTHGRHMSGRTIGVDGHTETLWPRS